MNTTLEKYKQKILKEFDESFGEMTGEVTSENGEWVHTLKPYIKVFLKSAIEGAWREAENAKFSKLELMAIEHMYRAWLGQTTKETNKDWFNLAESILRKVKNSITSESEEKI